MRRTNRWLSLALVLLLALAGLTQSALAQDQSMKGAVKTVRVGWYDSSYNYKDRFGRRFGYAYEYQQKIAAYTGWRYEYVEGSWQDLLEQLKAGEIDLMSDVSYRPEREEQMLFSQLPMGSESYHIFIDPENTGIVAGDVTTLNGKRIGVNQGSFQEKLFQDWAQAKGVQAKLVKLKGTEDDSIRKLESGEIDALVTIDTYKSEHHHLPAFGIGQSDFYFVVNRDRPDLLSELNAAMAKMQDEEADYAMTCTTNMCGKSASTPFSTWRRRRGSPGTAPSGWAIWTNTCPFAARRGTAR